MDDLVLGACRQRIFGVEVDNTLLVALRLISFFSLRDSDRLDSVPIEVRWPRNNFVQEWSDPILGSPFLSHVESPKIDV